MIKSDVRKKIQDNTWKYDFPPLLRSLEDIFSEFSETMSVNRANYRRLKKDSDPFLSISIHLIAFSFLHRAIGKVLLEIIISFR